MPVRCPFKFCMLSRWMTEAYIFAGVENFCINPRFHPTSEGWNLGLTRKFPNPIDLFLCGHLGLRDHWGQKGYLSFWTSPNLFSLLTPNLTHLFNYSLWEDFALCREWVIGVLVFMLLSWFSRSLRWIMSGHMLVRGHEWVCGALVLSGRIAFDSF